MQVQIEKNPALQVPRHLMPHLRAVQKQLQTYDPPLPLKIRAYASLPTDRALASEMQGLLCVQPQSSGKRQPPPYSLALTPEGSQVVCLPRSLGLNGLSTVCRVKAKPAPGVPQTAIFPASIRLRPYQEQACQTVVDRLSRPGPSGALLVADCGAGKTVMALEIMRRIGVRAAVVVHKEFLMTQWEDRIRTFLPSAFVGRVQRDTADIDGSDIVLCMMHTLVQRDYPAEIMDTIGLVIYDETHHVCAKTFAQSLRHFAAKRRLGLTATPDRADGLGYLVTWMLGPVVCTVRRARANNRAGVVVHKVPFNGSVGKLVFNRMGEPCFTSMVTKLVKSRERNTMLAQLIARLVLEQGRKVLVASARRNHLQTLQELLPPSIQTGLYVGESSKKAKAHRDTHAADWDVVLTTFRMGEEGLDLPHLNTLVIASPKKAVEQLVGRVTRRAANGGARVYDVCDSRVSMFVGMHRKRCAHYARMGYGMRVHAHKSFFIGDHPQKKFGSDLKKKNSLR